MNLKDAFHLEFYIVELLGFQFALFSDSSENTIYILKNLPLYITTRTLLTVCEHNIMLCSAIYIIDLYIKYPSFRVMLSIICHDIYICQKTVCFS